MPNSTAANVLGTIGAVCWTIQLVPQIWKSFRQKSTKGLSEFLVLLWAIAATLLGVYNVLQNLNIPLIVQPQLMATLSLISWSQCQYYGRQCSRLTSTLTCVSLMLIFGGFEAGMIFAIKPSYERGETSGTTGVRFFGIMASVLLAIGLLPQYYEIYRYKKVIGISVLFMFVDAMGGIFSILSLVFEPKFDIIAGVLYGLVSVMDMAIVLASWILNPLADRRQHRIAEQQTISR